MNSKSTEPTQTTAKTIQVPTDAEHDEIMRLHIIEGYTIGGAIKAVLDKRREQTP